MGGPSLPVGFRRLVAVVDQGRGHGQPDAEDAMPFPACRVIVLQHPEPWPQGPLHGALQGQAEFVAFGG